MHGNKIMNSISVRKDVITGHGNQKPQVRAHQTINQSYDQSNLLRKIASAQCLCS